MTCYLKNQRYAHPATSIHTCVYSIVRRSRIPSCRQVRKKHENYSQKDTTLSQLNNPEFMVLTNPRLIYRTYCKLFAVQMMHHWYLGGFVHMFDQAQYPDRRNPRVAQTASIIVLPPYATSCSLPWKNYPSLTPFAPTRVSNLPNHNIIARPLLLWFPRCTEPFAHSRPQQMSTYASHHRIELQL